MGLPLTRAQAEVWFDEQIAAEPPAYNMADFTDLRGPLDAAVLRRALRRVVAEADALRVRFAERDGEPRQFVHPCPEPPLAEIDVSGADDPEAAARAWMERDLADPLKTTDFPLFRAALLRLSPDRHLLYQCFHHIVGDGYSRTVLHPRLAAVYGALVAGEPEEDLAATAPPPLRELVEDELAYPGSPAERRDRAYWSETMPAAPDLVSLSGADPLPCRGRVRRTVSLPPERARALGRTAWRARATLPVALIAAVAAYVGRMTGTDEPMLTLPVSARVGARARAVPGMVANYLPLRVQAGPRMTRRDLLRSAYTAVSGALEHQRYRGERVRRDAGLRADDRRPFGPLVNVLDQDAEPAFGPCRAVVANLSTGIVNDLIFNLHTRADGGVDLHLDGNPDLYEPAELAAHLDRLRGLLDALLDLDEDAPIGRLPIVTPDEAARLAAWNDTAAGGGPPGVVERLREHAARDGDRIAVTDPDGSTSYRDLAGWTADLADRLRARGVGHGDLVAVLADPGVRYIGAALAVLSAGAAWVPLDAASPPARLAALLADSGAALLLTDRAEPGVDPGGVGVLVADGPVTGVPDDRPVPGTPDDIAYVMFTSGSTGKPKGAMVRRRGMVNHLQAKVDDLGLTAADTVVQNAPLTFDVSVWQMFAPLLVGGTVRVTGTLTAADPVELFGIAARERVTVLELVPSLLKATLADWELNGPVALPDLRWLMTTGEALAPELCPRWHAFHPHVPIMNAYGPTECSDDVTHGIVTAEDPPTRRTPIGAAVRNTRLHVLGDELQHVPPGVPGELYVAGTGVGGGYLRDPAKTAAAFVPDPYGPPGTRLYRTGDRVVRRADGRLEFIERRDHQTKINGRRVELAEIETALRSLPGVADAATRVVPAASGGTRLVAYLTGPDPDPERVRGALAELLPAYMVPSVWTVLDALPLTPNGKLDRKALPDPAAPAAPREAPAGDAEQILCALFTEVLGAPAQPGTDFFEHGGDSILAIQVVSRARRRGVAVTTRDVFAAKTPAALAALAVRTGPEPVVEDDGVGALGLTPIAAQLREDAGPIDGPVRRYSQHVAVRVPAGIGTALLDTALRAVVAHHAALRMRVRDVAGLWSPEVPAGTSDAPLTVRIGTEDPAALVEQQAAAARARLDPAAGTMLQAVHLDGGDRPGLLVLVAHHLAIDGLSWRILVEDLAAAAEALRAGRAVRLDPVGTSYRRWSRVLADQARTEVRGAELPGWLARTADDPRPWRSDSDTYATLRTLRLEYPAEATRALLTEVPAAFHAEINDVLLTAFALAVADRRRRARRTEHRACLVELEGHGREQLTDDLDLARTVGWFTAAFPVRLDPGDVDWDDVWAAGPAVGDALKRIKEQLRALPDRGVGHGLLRHLNPQAAPVLAARPRPRLGFNYLGRFDVRDTGDWTLAAGGGPVVGTGAHPATPLPHLLDVTPVTEDRADGPVLVAHWNWAGRAVPDAAAEDLARTWFRALDALAAHVRRGGGGLSPSDVPLADVGQDELDAYAREPSGAADVLPLTPLQRGLLFHAGTGDLDPYTLQVTADLVGPLDPAALRAAAAALTARHPALRASFRLREDGDPVQVVAERVEVPWREADATDETELADLAAAERLRPFDLARPPALRFVLARTGPDRHRLIWTVHHIAVDGWSMPVLAGELLALLRGDDLPPAAPHRRYLEWLAARDRDAAAAAFRDALGDDPEPTLLVPPDAGRRPVLPESLRRDLPADLTARLTGWARSRGLTLNTVVQGCFAILLSRLTGRSDVTFGVVSAGRPAELPDVETAVGMFLTTIPLRVAVPPDVPVATLLRDVQDRQRTLAPHEHLGLAAIHRAVRARGDLFDTAVLFENFPMGSLDGDADLRVENPQVNDARHYPLSLAVLPGERLGLRLDHAPDLIDRRAAERICGSLERLLADVADADDATETARVGEPGTAPRRPVVTAPPVPHEPGDAAVEGVLRDLFARILGVAAAADTDFFHAGGDSIRAIRLVSHARSRGIGLSSRDVFALRTPAALAARARAAVADAAAAEPLLELSAEELSELGAGLAD